jgi:hypothetical protein
MVKNRVSGLLDRYPELSEQRPCKDIFSRRGQSWLKQIQVKEVDRRILDQDLEAKLWKNVLLRAIPW